MKRFFLFTLKYSVCIFTVLAMVFQSVQAAKKTNIVLDPGHGEDYNFHTFQLDDYYFTEFELNWKIALYLYRILDAYPEIEVHLTKNDEYEHPSLKQRVKTAAAIKKKTKLETYLISLHNNARSDGISDITDEGQKGCMVLASNLNYKPKLAEKIDELGYLIVEELAELGLYVNFPEEGGIWRRDSKKSKYPNGKKADYYGLIQRGIYDNIPTIIVEHAYMTDIDDVRNYLTRDEDLHRLAVADAKAIIEFLDLKWVEERARYAGSIDEIFD